MTTPPAGTTTHPRKRRRVRPEVRVLAAWVVDDDYPAFDHKAIVYVLDVGGVIVRLFHWSGRFDGPVEVLARHIDYLIDKYDLDGGTTTESQQRGARRVVRRKLGRRFYVKQRGEYLWTGRKTLFFAMPAVDPILRVYTQVAGYAGWRNMRAGVFIVRLRQLGIPIGWWVFHGPSGIQSGNAWSGDRKQVQIAKAGYPRLGAEIDRAEDKRPDLVAIPVGDTNWHAAMDMGLDFIEDALDAQAVFRPGHLPKQGTHRESNRVIDNAFPRHATRGARVDHGTIEPHKPGAAA